MGKAREWKNKMGKSEFAGRSLAGGHGEKGETQRCFRVQRDAEDTVMTYSIRIDLDKRTTGTVRRVDQNH